LAVSVTDRVFVRIDTSFAGMRKRGPEGSALVAFVN
jgi:hypothetical protein